jgi:LPS export ABC transporter protein LptC
MIERSYVALAACVLLGACNRDAPTPPLAAKPILGDSADQVMFGMRTLLTRNGIQRAELLADTAFTLDGGNRLDLKRVNTTFYTASGAKDATMTGERGSYDVRQQQLEGRGNVVIVTTSGCRLESPHLVYNQARNEVSSDTNFTFTQPGRKVSGIGFVSDPGLRSMRILRSYQGVLAPSSRQSGCQ